MIGITGRIQTRNYENAQGQRVYITEVIAENFQMLESRNQQQEQQQAKPQQAKQPDPFAGGAPMDLNDDDLPF